MDTKYIAIIVVVAAMLVATTAIIGNTAFAGFQLDPINRKVPIAIVGDNVYIVWPSNKTGNNEVMFRSSNDNSATFADKINLSNSRDSESQDAEIAADGDNVIVTWWERNATSEEPVARISSDNGASFGPLLRLATNGTIGQAAAEE